MNENEKKIILDALENANYLISEEYQSLLDEDLKQKYDVAIQKLNTASQILKQKC